jgi:hypothetical protein
VNGPIRGLSAELRRLVARLLGQDAAVLAAVVLAGLVVVAGVSGRFGLAGAAMLAAISIVWLTVNGPMEGPVLVQLSATHGITGADLAGVAGLGLAAIQAVRARRERAST